MTDRRERILRVAEKLLCHYGVRKTTVHDIARSAEIGVGTIYIEFSSKGAILEELARARHARVLTKMKDAAETATDFEERFRAVMNARIDSFLEMSQTGEHATELVHCSGCEAVEAAFEEFRARQRRYLTEFLESEARSESLAFSDPQLAAETVLRAYSTFSPPEIYELDVEELERLRDALHQMALRGLLRSSM